MLYIPVASYKGGILSFLFSLVTGLETIMNIKYIYTSN